MPSPLSRAMPALVLASLLAPPAFAAPTVPDGYVAEEAAGGLTFVTGLAFDARGVLHASEGNLFTGTGRVLRLEDRDGDGSLETVTTHADGFGIVTGIAFLGPAPRGRGRAHDAGAATAAPMTHLERIRRGQFAGRVLDLVVSHYEPGGTGTISIVHDRDGDGVADARRDVVTGLPSDGVTGNQQPAIGPDGRIHFGQGARTNAGAPAGADGPLNAAILRVEPDGSGLEVLAEGLRNAFDLAFTPDGRLFATENGPDPSGPGPVAGAPDELNEIVSGAHYGWPGHFGAPPEGTGTIGPLVTLSPSTSTNGLALVTPASWCGLEGGLVAAQFGSFIDPTIGRRIVHVAFVGERAARVDVLATGFGRPLDLAFGPEGDLWVADFSNVAFAPGTGAIWRIRPVDADGDGTPDACEGG